MGMDKKLKQYAVEFARLGGSTKSERKSNAARKNGKKGGRPRKGEATSSVFEVERKISRKI